MPGVNENGGQGRGGQEGNANVSTVKSARKVYSRVIPGHNVTHTPICNVHRDATVSIGCARLERVQLQQSFVETRPKSLFLQHL